MTTPTTPPTNPQEEPTPKTTGPQITSISLSNDDTICNDVIFVGWEKETGAATLNFTCSSSHNPDLEPTPPVNLATASTSGTTEFNMTHDEGANETGVTVTATITQGSSDNDNRTVNVDCTEGERAGLALAAGIEEPIPLVHGQDLALSGTYSPATGDTIIVRVQKAYAKTIPEDLILGEHVAPVDPQNGTWALNVPSTYWANPTPVLHLRVLLKDTNQNKIVSARTFATTR